MLIGMPWAQLVRPIAPILTAGALLSSTVAHAGCVHTGQVFSCTDDHGHTEELYCLGVGAVLTCMEPTGSWILVGSHEVLSQISSVDSQVSSALAVAHHHGGSNNSSDSHGTVRANSRTLVNNLLHDHPREAPLASNPRKDFRTSVARNNQP